MGGNTLRRQNYTKEEIENLYNLYKDKNIEFYNPITGKILKNKIAWKASLSVKMFPDCLCYFLYLDHSPAYSEYSGERLTFEDFNLKRGFRRFSKDEIDKKVWTKNYITSEKTKAILSKRIKEIMDSEQGIEIRKKMTVSHKKFNNSERGKQIQKEKAKKQSDYLKKQILEGKFTPNVTNTWTHWNAQITIDDNIYKFRSSWEACFWFCNQQLLYETIRVRNGERVYVNDFYDEKNRILYEIKPLSQFNKEIEKINTFINYCLNNNMKFIWINENNIHNFLNINLINNNESAKEQYKKVQKYAKIKN
jgi:hypothetical protein